MYAASPHISFKKFCEESRFSNGINYDKFKEKEKAWFDKKKRAIAQAQAEALGQAIFSAQGEWHKNVLETVTEYPKSANIIHDAIMIKARAVIEMMEFDHTAVKTCELVQLATAQKIITEAKKSALMIDKYSPQNSQDWYEGAQAKNSTTAQKWVVVGKGGMEEMDSETIEQKLASFYDKKTLNDIDDDDN